MKINLSEIVNKLKLFSPRIERKENLNLICVYSGKGLIFQVYKNKICPINVIPYEATKWFFKLWLDDYIVVDDMKEECE